jgi:excisionase family DNA binding protein
VSRGRAWWRRRVAEPRLPDFVTARQLAEALGVSEDWIYQEAAAKRLPSYKLGGHRRFIAAEVEAWLASKAEGERENVGEVHPIRKTA